MVGGATGITVAQALKAADRRLSDIKDDALAAIDAKIERLTALAWSTDPDRWTVIYRGANEIFALAGAFGLDHLSDTAYSLCCLLARGEELPAVEAAAIVHLEAMRALRRAADSGADRSTRAEIVAGLRDLVTRSAVGQCSASGVTASAT
jgi:hypothetical protein